MLQSIVTFIFTSLAVCSYQITLNILLHYTQYYADYECRFLQDEPQVSVPLYKKNAAQCWRWGSPIQISLQVAYVAYSHMPVGVTSNTYCNHKCCTLTVISTLTYIPLPTGAQGLLAHPVFGMSVTNCLSQRLKAHKDKWKVGGYFSLP